MIPFSGNRHLKKNSNRILIFRISSWNCFEYLCQSAQRRLSCNTFFLRSIPLELHLELNSGSSFPKPRLPYGFWRSPLSAVSSTCKEITWDKCFGSACLVLFTASLTKKCVVWNCALSKWKFLHNETSVTKSIWIQHLLHLKSRRTCPRRHPINAQFLTGTS